MARDRKSEGFGFVPSESIHHFLVTIPSSRRESVYISEHFNLEIEQDSRQLSLAQGNEDGKIRVILPRHKWDAFSEAVQDEFNHRLRRNGLRTGRWKIGQTPVARLLGKELVLLSWAVEDADPALIPVAIKNWLGLAPEERWWLFTMTNAATGHAVYGRNKGWRKAVRYALTENPISDALPEPRRDLFLIMEEAISWSGLQRDTSPQSTEGEVSGGRGIY